MTPLHAAAHGGHTLCVQILLQNNADITILDKRGSDCFEPIDDLSGISALSYAAYSGSLSSIMLLLQESNKLKHGHESPSGINHTDNSGMTPLLFACK